MRNFGVLLFSLHSFFVLLISLATSHTTANDKFLHCLSLHQKHSNSIPIPIYSPHHSPYLTIFNSSARNLRALSSNLLKPLFVITPLQESHVQAAVVCCRKHGLDLKVRSGGHDVEGLSYVSDVSFVIVDLVNYRNITIDVDDKSAWIQAGAQIGEVYYNIAQKSRTLGFPAGFCPTVGVGGHFSGGGLGTLVRKHGLSCDHILDARIVDVEGKILDKESMGEDLFWAIRGGGENSFGVVLWWKILFLGGTDKLLQIIREYLPELVLQRKDCIEMSWVESHVFFFLPGSPLEVLLDRDPPTKSFLKVKTDYAKVPVSKAGLDKMWSKFMEGDGLTMFWTPLGGKMNEISEFETPYPHRAGYIYNILYTQTWFDERNSEANMDWIRKFYSFMAPYVSKFPRTSYLNYKDLDLGDNKDGALKSYLTWGSKYFKNNFNRLVYVKKKVDPGNFFKNEQSIPPY